ncbi:unnamed protein product [Bursaphelenchus okinawaensis]|uniref:Uncharacterized protein n=1 Tax=Bursaphelenchus okinawaensis TaxID=465554 RepID=A0A811LUC8_9BILA|nr:unnamed protein product [Bursaphelenchus okinawaensis]CAG9128208.1 unnamed protein product [Bursaphelenchus okinawaensis]
MLKNAYLTPPPNKSANHRYGTRGNVERQNGTSKSVLVPKSSITQVQRKPDGAVETVKQRPNRPLKQPIVKKRTVKSRNNKIKPQNNASSKKVQKRPNSTLKTAQVYQIVKKVPEDESRPSTSSDYPQHFEPSSYQPINQRFDKGSKTEPDFNKNQINYNRNKSESVINVAGLEQYASRCDDEHANHAGFERRYEGQESKDVVDGIEDTAFGSTDGKSRERKTFADDTTDSEEKEEDNTEAIDLREKNVYDDDSNYRTTLKTFWAYPSSSKKSSNEVNTYAKPFVLTKLRLLKKRSNFKYVASNANINNMPSTDPKKSTNGYKQKIIHLSSIAPLPTTNGQSKSTYKTTTSSSNIIGANNEDLEAEATSSTHRLNGVNSNGSSVVYKLKPALNDDVTMYSGATSTDSKNVSPEASTSEIFVRSKPSWDQSISRDRTPIIASTNRHRQIKRFQASYKHKIVPPQSSFVTQHLANAMPQAIAFDPSPPPNLAPQSSTKSNNHAENVASQSKFNNNKDNPASHSTKSSNSGPSAQPSTTQASTESSTTVCTLTRDPPSLTTEAADGIG